ISLTASVTANGSTISKVQFYYNTSTLIGEDSTPPYTFTWANVSQGNYAVFARAVYNGSATVDSGLATIRVTGLPAPWLTADIGTVSVGSADESSGTYTVAGAGNISGKTDNFRFVYQALTADGEI